MSKGAVTRIIDFSAVDGPGNRMVIFLQGCNFNCWYCHNPETIPLAELTAPEETHTEAYAVMDAAALVMRYRKASPFISGVTFSGGECTVQFDFLLEACKALKAAGAHILIDTNGHLGPDKLARLLEVADGLMLDIKALDPTEHRALTGAENHRVLQTFKKALASGQLAEVRTVIRGEAPDALKTVAWVARHLAEVNPEIPYRLIRYRQHGVRKDMLPRLKAPDDVLLAQCRAIAESAGLKKVIVT